MGDMIRRFKCGLMYVVVTYREGRAWCSFNGGPSEAHSPEYVTRMVVSGKWRPTDGGL